jgi:hypothetical protein
MRWAEFLENERHDLLEIAALWRRRVGGKEAIALDKISWRLRRRPMLMVLPWLVVGLNAFVMVALLSQDVSPQKIWELTFQHTSPEHAHLAVPVHVHVFNPYNPYDHRSLEFPAIPSGMVPSSVTKSPLEANLYLIWMISLGLGYLCHWYAVRSHTTTVNALVKWTNRLAKENNFPRIRSEVQRLSLNPGWIILGILMCVHSGWWGIPLVFAGSLQKRYMTKSSPAIRMALAGQIRDGFAMMQNHGDHFCTGDHCGARLPEHARFCPRCGTAV